ncbi:MAG: AlpA family transcriptional regulator [Sulfuritalea sp.]|nr:AlpA family transcriptional regulator [Sulfuritalea sp.]
MANTILRLPFVKARTGLSRSTIYLRIAAGAFPAPVNLGSRAVGWLESEIDDWLTSCVKISRSPTNKKGLRARP